MTIDDIKTVTVLGLGAMGSRMAANLAKAGFDVAVWNRSPEAAARLANEVPLKIAATAKEAVSDADAVVSMVADDQASRSIWLDSDTGALPALPPGSLVIEASTLTPATIQDLSAAVEGAGVSFLEAPVVGSRPQADAGALFVLAGGAEDVLDRARPVLETYAGGIRHVGPHGSAATMKLAINGLFGIQVAAYAEIVGLLEASDVSTDLAIEVLTGLPITSPGLQRILGLFAARDFAPNFPVPLVAKDFRYLEALASELGADLPVTATTRAVYDAGASEGQEQFDIAGIVDRYLP